MPLTLRIDDNPCLKRMIGDLVAETTIRTKSAMLRRLLRRRFGDIPETAVARIDTADEPTLDVWLERFVDTQTIKDVLEGQEPA